MFLFKDIGKQYICHEIQTAEWFYNIFLVSLGKQYIYHEIQTAEWFYDIFKVFLNFLPFIDKLFTLNFFKKLYYFP